MSKIRSTDRIHCMLACSNGQHKYCKKLKQSVPFVILTGTPRQGCYLCAYSITCVDLKIKCAFYEKFAFRVEARGEEFTTAASTEGFVATICTYTEITLYDEEEAFFILCEEDTEEISYETCEEDTEEISYETFDETSDQRTELILSDNTPSTDTRRKDVEKPKISTQIQQTTRLESDICTIKTQTVLSEEDYFSDNVEELFPRVTVQPGGLVRYDVAKDRNKDTNQERHQAADEDFQVSVNTTQAIDPDFLIPDLEKHLKETEGNLLQSKQHFLNILTRNGNDPSLLTSSPSLSQTTDSKYDGTLAGCSGQVDSNANFVLPSSQENKTLAHRDKDLCIKETDEGSEEGIVPMRSSLKCTSDSQSKSLKRVRFSEKLIIELDKFGDFQNCKVIDISKGTPIEKLSGTFDDICYRSRTFLRTTVFRTVLKDHIDHLKPPVLQKRNRKNRRRKVSVSTSKKQLVYSAQSVGTLWL
uniref:Uncharacterized protein n=1 Tax=Branchiostoma floridae TaxID=7739 RepID=C3ZEY8_BRAFL|eukprot:XP_002593283.1 hypothetical protein BRAFLDRAFT_83828 [Branchiostoma floridae]